jgi:stress response protein YsnF
MSQTVIGIFDSANEAQNAVQNLVTTGFTRERIDISTQNNSQRTASGNDDSIGGFFSSLFGGDDEAKTYSHVARQGSVVTLHAQTREEAERAAQILDRSGAVDVNEKAAQTGFMNSGGDSFDSTTNRSIPIIEENLQVGKREVETGGVRLNSRIVERPVEEHLRLREEHVNVQRNAVNRPATETDLNTFREGSIELTEHAEVPVVNKEARVVEEITFGKEVTERDEVVRDTVRKTEVDVDNLNKDSTNNRHSDTDRDRI